MRTFTLDTNCLIGIEAAEPTAACLRRILQAHQDGRIEVAVPAIAASERQKGGTYLAHFDGFRARVANLGLDDAPLLQPIAYWDISFYGMGYWADEAMVDLERQIHEVLHPEVEFTLAEFCAARGIALDTERPSTKWRNAKCDVQALWSHFYHKRECFVTSDRNFLKETKLPRLLALGANSILTPEAAGDYLDRDA